jgi:uncharacterized membrane protein YeaQ/YmgE (transglycosylase-associated protein family)
MIGMSFPAFLTLLVLGLISSFVLHVLVRYRMLAGFDGFMSKWIAGWIGGWLGSSVFGFWGIHTGSLYVIPALLGAFTGSFMVTAVFRALAQSATSVRKPDTVASQPSSAPQLEIRKAS